MTYPTKYTRQYDFQSYQVSNPTRPLPGDKVNYDLNAVKQSITEVIDFLKTSIRADGHLANGSVGVNQLDATFDLGFSLPTVWEAGVDYTTDSTVLYGNVFYKANVAHTSTDGFDESKWDVIVDFGAQATAAAASATAALASENAAASSATAASGSAGDAADDAAAAANSATAASGSATTATTQAGLSSDSATAAATSEANAATSATAAAASATAADGSATAAAASAASITIASQAEAEAGTDNTKLMTPLRVAESIAASPAAGVSSLNGQTGALTLFSPPQGRLTLSTGVAVMTSTVSAATTVYYTPSMGNMCPINDGMRFVPTSFSELSQLTTDATKSPAACTTNSNYDLFVWNDSGTIRCTRGPAWSSNTSRGTGAGTSELDFTTAFPTNKNAITNGPAANRGTWVGTIRTNGSSQVDYSVGGSASGGVAGNLSVWNMYNRNLTTAKSIDSGTSYTYSTDAYRQARASAGNQCSVLVGLAVDTVNVAYQQRVDTAATAASRGAISIGEDSTTANTAPRVFTWTPSAAVVVGSPYTTIVKTPLLGYHTYAALERGDGTTSSSYNADSLGTLVLQAWN